MRRDAEAEEDQRIARDGFDEFIIEERCDGLFKNRFLFSDRFRFENARGIFTNDAG